MKRLLDRIDWWILYQLGFGRIRSGRGTATYLNYLVLSRHFVLEATETIAGRGSMAVNNDPGEESRILPILEPIPGITIDHPLALLTPEELIEVRKNLDLMARNRREAEASTGSIRLS